MKALTIRQPWASEVIAGTKDIEYRSRRTHYRGPILIHAAKVRCPDAPELPLGVILGRAELVDCVGSEGEWEWLLRNVHRFSTPIPCAGQLGLWRVPADVLAKVATVEAIPVEQVPFAETEATDDDEWEDFYTAICEHCQKKNEVVYGCDKHQCVGCGKSFEVGPWGKANTANVEWIGDVYCDHCNKKAVVPVGVEKHLCQHCWKWFPISWDAADLARAGKS